MSRKRITVSLSSVLVEKLNEKRGLVKMSTFVEDLLSKSMEETQRSPPMARSVR
jgi:metal-responsive CopG/Arc/MetJ family transcriptional regulator